MLVPSLRDLVFTWAEEEEDGLVGVPGKGGVEKGAERGQACCLVWFVVGLDDVLSS